MKTALKIIGVVVGLLILALIALPFIINVNTFRPQIEASLTSAMGRQVKIGNMSLSLFQGSLSADDLSVADDPAFSKQPFIKAKTLDVGVEMKPLIFSRQLNVTNLTIEEPSVALIRNAEGKWNFSSIGGSNQASQVKPAQPAPAAAQGKSAPAAGTNPNVSVAKLQIKNGTITMSNIGTPAKPQVYKDVDVDVTNFSFASQFPFSLSASLPGGGTAKVDGKCGPISQTDAALTPLQANVAVKQLDLAGSGFVDPASGIAGIATYQGTLTSDGKTARTNGTVALDKLKLSPKGTPAPKTVNVKYATAYELATNAGQLTQGNVSVGQAIARLSGTYKVDPAATVLNMKLNADNMPVNDLAAMLPSMGVTLPKGSSLQGGTLSADMTIAGPVDKLVITGPVKLVNTKLVGFSFGSKLAAISQFTGGSANSSPDTMIQNLSANVRSAPEGIATQNVNLSVANLGVVTGSGTVSPQDALNYTMNAQLGGQAGQYTKGGLPFAIQGTASDPKFIPNVQSIVKNQLNNFLSGQGKKGQGSPLDQLNGLLGGKKK
ncbi:MAG TPA: AsmA family protein [Terriglobales bacterium]